MEYEGQHSLKHDFRDTATSFSRLHPTAITERNEVYELLNRVCHDRGELRRGMSRKILPEIAQINKIGSDGLLLTTRNFAIGDRHRIFLNFTIDDMPYFFSSLLLERYDENAVRIEMPSVIYQSERRDHLRHKPRDGDSKHIAILSDSRYCANAEISNSSLQGLGIILLDRSAKRIGMSFQVKFLDGRRMGEEVFAEVRRNVPLKDNPGWVHVGLDVSSVKRRGPLKLEKRDFGKSGTRFSRVERRWFLFSAATRIAADRALERLWSRPKEVSEIRIVEFRNEDNEMIRGIVDSTGDTKGAPVVIIPPAWGKTKESLLPLSACLIAGFRSANLPLSVIRFDGIRKRGESHGNLEYQSTGNHHHGFTFSQGARDIRATVDFLDRSPAFKPSKRILVSFSASAIEARRATADDPRIDGWISVVGASDLQSMMRVISGGVDYAAGLERGISFGLQQILGIEVDMDYAGADAFRHSLAYLGDARRDMARIGAPITWIHGKYDAWMDSERAIDALSRGDTSKRKFIEVPTGHILRTGQEALETFQLITREVSQMVRGLEMNPGLPDFVKVERRRQAERNRLPKEPMKLKEFWRDYLVGRGEDLGIDLMTSIAPYREMMEVQFSEMNISGGEVLVDLGAGSGSFPRFLAEHSKRPENIQVIEFDFVRAGLERARGELTRRDCSNSLKVGYVETDLDLNEFNGGIALRSQSVDVVLASLLISYVREPDRLVREIRRVLRPGGRLVLSSLCRDADMSKLYMEGITELRSGLARDLFGKDGEREIEEAARRYLNQASRLLQLEEGGDFRFWDSSELKALVRRGGFGDLSVKRTLGNPPQAVVVSGERR